MEEFQNKTTSIFDIPTPPSLHIHHGILRHPVQFVIGSDMRTLRNQFHIIREEIVECVGLQKDLLDEGIELWTTMKKLMNANKRNLNKMKEELKSMNDSFQRLLTKRRELETRLLQAKSAQQEFEAILEDLRIQESVIVELDYERNKADLQLSSYRDTTMQLESKLRETVTVLQNLHIELNGWKSWKYSKELEEKADLFFSMSRFVVAFAFRRFASRVRKVIGLKKSCSLLSCFYQKWFLPKAWRAWCVFVRRSRFTRMHRLNSTVARYLKDEGPKCGDDAVRPGLATPESIEQAFDLKILYFAKWKVFRALENRFHAARTHRLLRTAFVGWREGARVVHLERYQEFIADSFREERQGQLLQRRMFDVWRQSTMFLEWDSADIEQKFDFAASYHKHRILLSWRAAAALTKESVSGKVCKLLRLQLGNRFSSWVNLYRFREFNKIHIYKRALHKFKSLIRSRELGVVRDRCVERILTVIARMQCRRLVLRWRLYIARRMAFMVWQDNNLVLLFIRWRSRRCVRSLLHMRKSTATKKRLRYSYEIGWRSHNRRMIIRAWGALLSRKWRLLEGVERHPRSILVKRYLKRWRRLVVASELGVDSFIRAIQIHKQLQHRRKVFSFRRWYLYGKRLCKLKYSFRAVEMLRMNSVLLRSVRGWKLMLCRIISRDISIAKESISDASQRSCHRLEDVVRLEYEKDRLQKYHREMQTLQTAVQVAWLERYDLHRKILTEFQQLHDEVTKARTDRKQLDDRLVLVQAEYDRISAIQTEIERNSRLADEKRLLMLEQVKQENIRKLNEVQPIIGEIDKERAAYVEEEKRCELEDGIISERMLTMTEEIKLLDVKAREKKHGADELEQSLGSVEDEIREMKLRIQEIVKQGVDCSHHDQNAIRRCLGEKRVLRDIVGEGQARCASLASQIKERRNDVLSMHREDVSRKESEEMRRLSIKSEGLKFLQTSSMNMSDTTLKPPDTHNDEFEVRSQQRSQDITVVKVFSPIMGKSSACEITHQQI